MDKKLFGIILVVAVGVIMAGSLLAPIVSDYADEEKTYYNEGMPFAEIDEDTHTITVTSSAITVDGVEIDQSLFPGTFTQYTLVYGTDGFIRYDMTNERVDFRLSLATSTNYSFADGETVTIALDGASATVSSTDTSKTEHTLSGATHYIASEGDYVLALNPVVLSDTEIFGAGATAFSSVPSSVYTFIVWDGTISGVDATLLYYNPTSSYSSFEISDTTVNTTDLGNGLYRIDSVLIDYAAVDTDSNEYSMTSTYTYFLAPYEIVYENPTYLGSETSGLLAVVVVMFLVALIIIPTRFLNRDD